MDDPFNDELELLRQIYVENIELVSSNGGGASLKRLRVTLEPSSASASASSVNVRASLFFDVSKQYPNEPCVVLIDNCRGIDGEKLCCELQKQAKTLLGAPVERSARKEKIAMSLHTQLNDTLLQFTT